MRVETAKPGDVPFIMSSWLRSYRQSPHTRKFTDAAYRNTQRPRIEGLLARCDVLVARPDDWDDGIAGWLCFEQLPGRFVLHYAYTRSSYRGEGVFRELLVTVAPQGRLVRTSQRPPYSDALRGFQFDPRGNR